MTIAPHLAVGSAVALATRDPYLGFVAAIASHHVIDALPHVDLGSIGIGATNILENKKMLGYLYLDFALGALIMATIVYLVGFSWTLLAGAVGGILPDLIDNVPFWASRIRKNKFFGAYHRFHEFFHTTIENRKYFWFGYLIQVFLIAVSFVIIMIK